MRTAALILAAVAAAGWLALAARIGLVAARMLQIEEYENRRLLTWAADGRWLAHRSALLAGGPPLATLALLAARGHAAEFAAGGWVAGAVAGNWGWRWVREKRALVFTARMRRLLAVASLLLAACAAATALLVAAHPRTGAVVAVVVSGGVCALAPAALGVANLALQPVEHAVQARYLRAARRRIREVHPLVVAVAGSYGKTSTKHILAALLDGDGVLPTRKSFNTLMGITRVINEDLSAAHRLFIVEMDAYAPGEIARMCRLTGPRFSILTSVGPQHLERFGSTARIAGALYECVAALPADGVAVVHVGDADGAALARRAQDEGRRTVRYALAGASEADVVVDDVRVSAAGTAFIWRWPSRDLEREVTVPLLGRHQALNVAAALVMVDLLGGVIDHAVARAASLEPVEHRLHVLRPSGPVTVIDDSYNANPVGVHEGLDVLAAFPGGAKILVTPGLVELGALEAEENRRYGRHAAQVCDEVIVAEARTTRALLAGLREGGMRSERIHTVRDHAETTTLLGRLARSGDVVLFANDLPDTYLRGPGRASAVTTAAADT